MSKSHRQNREELEALREIQTLGRANIAPTPKPAAPKAPAPKQTATEEPSPAVPLAGVPLNSETVSPAATSATHEMDALRVELEAMRLRAESAEATLASALSATQNPASASHVEAVRLQDVPAVPATTSAPVAHAQTNPLAGLAEMAAAFLATPQGAAISAAVTQQVGMAVSQLAVALSSATASSKTAPLDEQAAEILLSQWDNDHIEQDTVAYKNRCRGFDINGRYAYQLDGIKEDRDSVHFEMRMGTSLARVYRLKGGTIGYRFL